MQNSRRDIRIKRDPDVPEIFIDRSFACAEVRKNPGRKLESRVGQPLRFRKDNRYVPRSRSARLIAHEYDVSPDRPVRRGRRPKSRGGSSPIARTRMSASNHQRPFRPLLLGLRRTDFRESVLVEQAAGMRIGGYERHPDSLVAGSWPRRSRFAAGIRRPC